MGEEGKEKRMDAREKIVGEKLGGTMRTIAVACSVPSQVTIRNLLSNSREAKCRIYYELLP